MRVCMVDPGPCEVAAERVPRLRRVRTVPTILEEIRDVLQAVGRGRQQVQRVVEGFLDGGQAKESLLHIMKFGRALMKLARSDNASPYAILKNL